MITRPLLLSLLAITSCVATAIGEAPKLSDSRARRFDFHYKVRIDGLLDANKIRIWLPVPRSNEYQKLESMSRRVSVASSVRRETRHGNSLIYLEADKHTPRPITAELTYRVIRREVRSASIKDQPLAEKVRTTYLRPNAKVPVEGLPIDLLANKKLPDDPLGLARFLYDRVDRHMAYDKSKPGYGNGDAVWACQSGAGNCTDFHSLFISLSRRSKLPARFVIGFPLPAKRGQGTIPGYHCWGEFHTGKKWVPVDISEADKNPELKQYYFGNLTENRIAFSMGRDLVLQPRQDGPPLNYFVYPYVEADKKPVSLKKIKMEFRWNDLKVGSVVPDKVQQ